MSRTTNYVILVAFAAVSVVLVAARPGWVSDQNAFLRDAVNHELLNIFGVILAITLASVANLHLEFNKIEERYQKVFLVKSRQNLKKGTSWLIGLFVAGVAAVVIKPILSGGETAQAVVNLFVLFVLLWQVLILVAITQLVFAIPADLTKGASHSPQSHPSPEEEKLP